MNQLRVAVVKPSMRVKLATLTTLLPLLLGGCIVIPEGREVVSGSDYKHPTIAFLSLPDASRKETLSTLGPPSWESKDLGVLLYLYQEVENYHIVGLVSASKGQTDPELWGLFIAYDENGLVLRHEICPVGNGLLEDECANWAEHAPPAR